MCIVCEQENRRKGNNHTGRLYKVYAYKDNALVGSGYAVVDDYTGAQEPTITDLMGNPMTFGQYDNVQVSGEDPRFVIVNGSKH